MNIQWHKASRMLRWPRKALFRLKQRMMLHPWRSYGDNLHIKKYRDINDYRIHQESKLRDISEEGLSSYDVTYRKLLAERVRAQGLVHQGLSVLCLAARIGTEVKAFIDIGCLAIGIDLNPGSNNRYVVKGDFHDIQYADGSFDVIFTNSLDHAFDMLRLIGEIRRVLKANGLLVLEVVKGKEEGGPVGYYESLYWDRIDDILSLFTSNGFVIVSRLEFALPWPGQHVSLRRIDQ